MLPRGQSGEINRSSAVSKPAAISRCLINSTRRTLAWLPISSGCRAYELPMNTAHCGSVQQISQKNVKQKCTDSKKKINNVYINTQRQMHIKLSRLSRCMISLERWIIHSIKKQNSPITLIIFNIIPCWLSIMNIE